MGTLKLWAFVLVALVALVSNCGSLAQVIHEEITPGALVPDEILQTDRISLLDIEGDKKTATDNGSREELDVKTVEFKPAAVEAVPSIPEETEVVKKETEVVKAVEANPELIVKAGRYSMFEESPFASRLETSIDEGYENIDGRVAPTINFNSNGQAYHITEARLQAIRQRLMYWFYDKGGDEDLGDYQGNIHSSTPQIHKNFNFQLPFYGFRYNYTRVSMHGYLEFSDPPSHYTYPLTFPVKDWPAQADPAFIGIFFSKCRIGSVRVDDYDQRRPGVYFRMERDLQGRTDQLGVEMKERLTWDIRKGVIGADSFDPKHAVIVTWKNMSFAGGIDNALYKTNSFQLVLATDEVFTYAIFNYAELQWSSHTEAGGDTTGGEGGVPAYIGFNAGNGTQSFEYSPYSQNSVLRDLTLRGWGNNITGRHIFRIDEKILLGSCNKDIDGANLPLVFAPESGNMLGGTIVNITGPCFAFDLTDRINCRFDTEDVIGKVMDRNRAVCVQPPLMAEGYVRFEVAVNTETYKWKGKYFVETPATATEKIFFETNDVHERNPAQIKISWNSYNLTINRQAQLRISVWGYRETKTRPELQFIDVLVDDIRNDGVYTISPAEYRLRDNIFTNDMQFGFIQINLTNPIDSTGLPITPVLWSRPIPLAWYFGPQWEKMYGKNWPERMCNNWLTTDRFYKNFAADIPLCPCTLEHALLDRGRFLPDFDCDKDANPKCFYHKEAVHCVRSGTPSLEGSGQQCCYDKYHYLMMSYDQQSGSRPHRSHNLGFLPWNEANKVPTLSHWFHDQIPYYQCCMWQEEQAVGCETYRFERRPTQDCVSYQPPGVAAIFGDPHIVTFDDTEYTFNGKGEFVLVRTDAPSIKLDVQGRFEQLPRNLYGPVMATQLTSVVAVGNSSAVIEVRVRPKHSQWRYHLDVFADGKRIYFDRNSLKIQHFPGVTVYTPTYILNQSEVIMMFQSGAGVEVVENEGFMTARVFLPWTYINKTRGLFGNWSWDPNDDFVRPDGTVASVNLGNFDSAHSQFGKYWALSDRAEEGKGAALFTREFGRTASYYSNATFQAQFMKNPIDFIPSNRTIDINKATELCGDSYQCRYDYGMSLNRDMAHFTKNYYDSVMNIKESNKKRIISCGVLETPRFGRKSNFFFVPGTKVTFECSQGFVLVGDMRRTCLPEGRWDIPVYGYTECLREQEYSSRQAGLTWAIIAVVVMPIFLILLCIWFCCIKKDKDGQTKRKWNMDTLTPKSRVNSRANLRAMSLANLTDTYKSDDSTKEPDFTRQQSDPYLIKKQGYESPSYDNEDPNTFDYPPREVSTFMMPKVELDQPNFEPIEKSKNAPPDHPSLSKKKRSYEKIYRTNEPLDEKHPNGEFPEKLWNPGEEEIISSGSNDDSGSGTLTRPATDIQYISQTKPKQYGRRAERTGGPTNPPSTEPPPVPLYVPSKYDDHSSTLSSRYSPSNSEAYTPSQSPNSEQYSPKNSFSPNSFIQPIMEEPSSSPSKKKIFGFPLKKKGKSSKTPLDQQGNPNQQGISSNDDGATLSSKTTMV